MLKLFLSKKFIIALLILVGIVGGKFFQDLRKAPNQLTVVKRGDIKEELTLSGKIEAEDRAVLRFEIAGRVNWVGVKTGDWIGAGQTVATLEKEKLEANLRQAWQDFTAAKAKSDKYYDSHKDSSESYDEKIERTALDATQNKAYDNVRIAQENLKGAVLTSPISGLVISVDPSIAGVNVTPVNASYEIINPSSLYLKVTADQTEIGSLSEGQKGTIIFDAYPEEKIIGEIENISFPPDTDETGTVYDIKVIFLNTSNNDYKYRLGMTADVDFVLQGKTNTIIIPTRMIKSDGKGKFVLVGKEKRKTYIKTGIENGQDSEITSGLKEGDVIYD